MMLMNTDTNKRQRMGRKSDRPMVAPLPQCGCWSDGHSEKNEAFELSLQRTPRRALGGRDLTPEVDDRRARPRARRRVTQRAALVVRFEAAPC
jgi:hypothetical protein